MFYHMHSTWLIFQFLDDCSTSTLLANAMNPHIKPVATKVFDECGRVIDNVEDLEDDMEIWLSYGEPWIDPNSES